jgi:DNA-directed RNA polymerase specialized sigma24 family protein
MASTFVLGQSELDALLACLGPGREQAGQQYEYIRHKLVRYFEGRHCVPADEWADETIDRVARRVAAGERILSSNPCRYFYGVARNVCLEWHKQQRRALHVPGVPALPERTTPEQLPCLLRCLDALPPGERELLVAYYLGSRTRLASHLGLTPNALRLRVFKGKQKVRACVGRCLQQPRAKCERAWKYPKACSPLRNGG